ncbi:MAG: tetratricopeptide repeat protein [Firmicutes bacterium]|nr:tetratricopeptide repeat protein [Bacillota bacterium]
MGLFDFLTGKKGPVSQDQLKQWAAQYASRKESSPGTAALAAGQYAKAVKEFTTQVNLGTKKEEAYLLRSLSHSLKGDSGSGLKDAQEAIKINQNNSEAFLIRGFAYIQKNDVNEALKDFKKAVALDLHGRGVVGKIAQSAIESIAGKGYDE